MQNEIWKDVLGYEGFYKASNLGNIKSLDRKAWNGKVWHNLKGRIIKQTLSTNGYYCVFAHKNGVKKLYRVHQLVAMAFLNHTPNRFKGLIVDHINNVKTDNRVENLQLVTARENLSKDSKKKYGTLIGAYFDKSRNTWRSDISINKKYKHLGTFKTELEAHLAYQKELKKLK